MIPLNATQRASHLALHFFCPPQEKSLNEFYCGKKKAKQQITGQSFPGLHHYSKVIKGRRRKEEEAGRGQEEEDSRGRSDDADRTGVTKAETDNAAE